MSGNVWEWCSDWNGNYPSGVVTDPAGASNGSGRVLRGGSWGGDGRSCRAASRNRVGPECRRINIGLRVVMDIPSAEPQASVVEKATANAIDNKTSPEAIKKPVQQKSTEVEGAEFAPFQKGQILFSGKKSEVWVDIPETLNGMMFSRYLTRQSSAAKVKIVSDCVVYMAVTTRWPGKNSGEEWQKECVNDAQIKNLGWKEVGHAKSVINSANFIDWTIYRKICKNGETLSYRTEKYYAPVIIVPK